MGRILDVCTRIGKSADPQLTVKESQGLREMTAAGDVRKSISKQFLNGAASPRSGIAWAGPHARRPHNELHDMTGQEAGDLRSQRAPCTTALPRVALRQS
jgi:hypothetical protein